MALQQTRNNKVVMLYDGGFDTNTALAIQSKSYENPISWQYHAVSRSERLSITVEIRNEKFISTTDG